MACVHSTCTRACSPQGRSRVQGPGPMAGMPPGRWGAGIGRLRRVPATLSARDERARPPRTGREGSPGGWRPTHKAHRRGANGRGRMRAIRAHYTLPAGRRAGGRGASLTFEMRCSAGPGARSGGSRARRLFLYDQSQPRSAPAGAAASVGRSCARVHSCAVQQPGEQASVRRAEGAALIFPGGGLRHPQRFTRGPGVWRACPRGRRAKPGHTSRATRPRGRCHPRKSPAPGAPAHAATLAPPPGPRVHR